MKALFRNIYIFLLYCKNGDPLLSTRIIIFCEFTIYFMSILNLIDYVNGMTLKIEIVFTVSLIIASILSTYLYLKSNTDKLREEIICNPLYKSFKYKFLTFLFIIGGVFSLYLLPLVEYIYD